MHKRTQWDTRIWVKTVQMSFQIEQFFEENSFCVCDNNNAGTVDQRWYENGETEGWMMKVASFALSMQMIFLTIVVSWWVFGWSQ